MWIVWSWRAFSLNGLDVEMWFVAWVTAASPELLPIEAGMSLLRIEAKAPRCV